MNATVWVSKQKPRLPAGLLCPEWDSNPYDLNGHRILSPACLPFHHPGSGYKVSGKNKKTPREREVSFERKTRLELATSTLARLRSTN